MNFKKCTSCDMENPETEIYCLECGTRLDPERRPARPSVRAGAPAAVPEPAAAPEAEAPTDPAAPSAVTAPAKPYQPAGEPKPEEAQKEPPPPAPAGQPAGPRVLNAHAPSRPAPATRPALESRVQKKPGGRLPAIPGGVPLLILAGAAIVFLAVVVWRLAFRPGRPSAAVPAANKIIVAVLPFGESGAPTGRGYFGEGLAEALIGGLSRLPGLRLWGGSSSRFLGANNETDGAQIGRQTGAGYVLAGSFEAAGKGLRVTAQLVRAADGFKVWGGQFDRSPGEVLPILQDIARGLVQALKISSSADSVNRLFGTRSVEPEACDLYFHGRSLAAARGKANLEKSVSLFQEAAAKDPGWAPIRASLAAALIELGSESIWPPHRAFPAARQEALKAVELEPGLVEARLALAILKWRSDWDFPGAEREFRDAGRANPGQPEVRRSFALFLSSLGRHDEAQSEIRTALDLDPLSPLNKAGLGMVLYYARLYDQAAIELAGAKDAAPSGFEACLGLGLLHIQTGDFAESLRMFQQAAALGGNPEELSLRAGVVLARQERRQEVGKILDAAIQQASRGTYSSSASLATVYAALNEPDQAQACLERAYAERDASLVFLKVSPLFDPLRSRAWFADLLTKIGF